MLAAVFVVGIAVGLAAPRIVAWPSGPSAAGVGGAPRGAAAQSAQNGRAGLEAYATAGEARVVTTPVLDTSRSYTTVQSGVVVPPVNAATLSTSPTCPESCAPAPTTVITGEGQARTAVLDTSSGYTTIQNGILVPPAR